MPSHAVVFLETPYNRYSLAVLTGVLERDERLEDVDLHFVSIEERRTAGIVKIPECIQQLHNLVRHHDKIVIALSFPTASIISIAGLLTALHQEFATGLHEAMLIVAGGPHPSGDPAGTLQLGVDVVAVGEAEVTFPALLDSFFREQTVERVKGLRFVDAAGQYHDTGQPSPIDISDFPPFALHHRRFCPMEISRGCPYSCRFCQTSSLMGSKMRHRSLDSIFRYAELTRKLDLKVLRFITPSAFAYGSPDGCSVNLDALEQMLRTVTDIYGKHGVYLGSFPSEVRPEQVTPETLELVKCYCANTNILIGAQSGSDRMLYALRRGHGVDEVVQATERIIKAGLTPNVDFMFGLPGETTTDRQATLTFITRLTSMGARVHSHTFMPLIGTPLADCPPGIVSDDVRELMLSLRGKNQEHGRWREQEQLARKIFNYLKNNPLSLL